MQLGDNWDPTNDLGEMQYEENGLYSYTALVPEGTWEYKVVLNQNWDQDTQGSAGNYSFTSDGLNPTTFLYDFRQNYTYLDGYNYECPSLGDMNADGGYNVLDVVTLVNCVLAVNCGNIVNGCAGDMNMDGGYNVLDVVTLVNCVLSQTCDGI